MKIKKAICLAIIMLTRVGVTDVFAQVKKENGHNELTNATVLFFPEFYHYGAITEKDTTYKYECYDANDRLINVDTLHNADIIHDIHFVESFYDRRNYKGGIISPPYFTAKLVDYEKAEKDTWTKKDRAIGITQITVFPDKIVRSDTSAVVDNLTGKKHAVIRKYYAAKDASSKN